MITYIRTLRIDNPMALLNILSYERMVTLGDGGKACQVTLMQMNQMALHSQATIFAWCTSLLNRPSACLATLQIRAVGIASKRVACSLPLACIE